MEHDIKQSGTRISVCFFPVRLGRISALDEAKDAS